MQDDGRIYVEFSPALKARLNNRVGLREVLGAAGIAAEVRWDAVPPIDPDERSKALVETVRVGASLAFSLAAAASLIESAITHYLDHQAVRDSHFVYWVNEPLVDAQRRPVLDHQGKPRTVRRRISGFDQFPAMPGGGVTITVGDGGLSLSLGADGGKAPPASSQAPRD